MAEQFDVTQDALTRFARTAKDRADRLRLIRGKLAEHSPSATAFGKLPESEETGKDYRERVDETLKNLEFAEEQQAQIADFIERTARSYQEVEDHTADEIRTIAGQARGTI